MKSLFSYLPKKLIVGLIATAAIAGVSSAAVAGFGPAGRPTMAWTPASNGADHVVFNSFTGVGNGIGDERDFLRGVQSGVDANWTDPVNNVQQDAEVEAHIYIHNNADTSLNTVSDGKGGFVGVAKNVNVRVALPSGIAKTQEATAYIKSSNALPTEISDTLDFTGANAGYFELDYEAGTAQLHDRNGTLDPSDDIVTSLSDALVSANGVNIADQKGCFEQVREITFKLKVKMPHYTVSKLVRAYHAPAPAGQPAVAKDPWTESVTATPGEMLEYAIDFENIGTVLLHNVIVVDDMPKNMVIEQGSVMLTDPNNPNGVALNSDVIQKNGTQLNVNLENSNYNTNAILTFRGKVPTADMLDCGLNHLVNAAYATPEGFHTIKDEATADVTRECTTVTPVYECTGVSLTKVSGRKISVKVSANATPANRVSIKNYEYNFGDGSTAFVTDKNPVEYTFTKDGTYKVSVKVNFTVDGQMKTSTQVCEAVVNFSSTPTPPTTIVDTGAGSMFGALAAISIVGALMHRVWTLRRSN